MFANQPTYDESSTGKRMSGLNGRKGEFSLAWDSGSNELNDFQRKKQKNKDVQVKLNYQEASHQEPIQRPSQASSNYQPVEAAKPYQISSPFALHTEAPKTNSSKSIPSFNEEEVLSLLKQYERIEDMPSEQLEKVMAYYESLKNPKQQPPAQENPYQRRTSSRKSDAPSSIMAAERREPIKPRESAGGIIYGSSKDIDQPNKPPSSHAQKKNQGTFVMGDGYNYFQDEAQRKVFTDQQNKIQAPQTQQPYNPRSDYKKISNIHFG